MGQLYMVPMPLAVSSISSPRKKAAGNPPVQLWISWRDHFHQVLQKQISGDPGRNMRVLLLTRFCKQREISYIHIFIWIHSSRKIIMNLLLMTSSPVSSIRWVKNLWSTSLISHIITILTIKAARVLPLSHMTVPVQPLGRIG